MSRVETFLERDALPLLVIALAAIFAPGLPWILGMIANG